MLVPETNTRVQCTGDDESAPKTRDSTRRSCIARSRRHVEATLPDGPGFAATPGVAARGPKTGAAVCVYIWPNSHDEREHRQRAPRRARDGASSAAPWPFFSYLLTYLLTYLLISQRAMVRCLPPPLQPRLLGFALRDSAGGAQGSGGAHEGRHARG